MQPTLLDFATVLYEQKEYFSNQYGTCSSHWKKDHRCIHQYICTNYKAEFPKLSIQSTGLQNK